jgi:hypothetical protein
MSAPSYDWWRSALRGEVGLIYEGDPQPGFYRKKAGKQGGWIPVAIWHDGSGMVALAGKKMVHADDIWTWVCRNPVQEAHYRQALSGGKWHDEIDEPVAGIGHNLPTDPVERFNLMIEMEREAIEAFLKVPIAAEDDAVKAGRWSGKLKDIAKEIDEKRVELKKPHDDAATAVQQTFKPLVDAASQLAAKLTNHVSPWVKEKKRKADEEAAEAARIKRDAEQKAADELGVAPPPETTRAPARMPSKVVTGGLTVRTVKVAKINDLNAAASYFAKLENPDLRDLMRKLAYKVMTAGVPVPGAELVEDQRVS